MPPPPSHKLFLLKEGRGRIIAHLLNITLVPQCSRCCIHPSAAAAAFVNCRRNDSRKSFYPHHTPHPTPHHVPPFSFPLYPAPFFFGLYFFSKVRRLMPLLQAPGYKCKRKKEKRRKLWLCLFLFHYFFLFCFSFFNVLRLAVRPPPRSAPIEPREGAA